MSKLFVVIALCIALALGIVLGRGSVKVESPLEVEEVNALPERRLVAPAGPPEPIVVTKYVTKVRVDSIRVEVGTVDSVCTTVPTLWRGGFRVTARRPVTSITSRRVRLMTYNPEQMRYEALTYRVPQPRWSWDFSTLTGMTWTGEPLVGVEASGRYRRVGLVGRSVVTSGGYAESSIALRIRLAGSAR